MENCYSYEALKTLIDTQYKALGDFNRSCCIDYLENVNESNFKKYQEVLEKQGKTGEFNLFEVIYPNWWHENFHSKMLKFLLENYHDFRDNFLDLIDADKGNYQNPIIECESDRIDVTIKGEKNVIIIENKLNWAGDQNNQIYRYYEKMTETRNLMVDKIVYLSPSKNKIPSDNSLGYDTEESVNEQKYIEDINKKLVQLIGFDGGKEDLVSCLEKSKDDKQKEDYRVFLNHYIEILKQTGAGDMSIIANEFLEAIRKSDDPQIGKKLAYMKEMLDNIYLIRVKFWKENFKDSSLSEPLQIIFKNYEINDVTYYIDVIISNLGLTKVLISNRYDAHNKNSSKKIKYDQELKTILDSYGLGELKRGTNKNALYKDFDFIKEDDAALEFVKKIDAILSKLNTN